MNSWSTGALGLALVSVVMAGCGQPVTDAPSATDRCDDVAFPQVQFGSHLLGDNEPPVAYSSTPPTSGWHTSGAVPEGVFIEALSEPAQVTVLEAGGVVVTYNALPEEDLLALTAAVTGDLADRVVLSPYDGIPAGHTAFTSWGAMQICDGVDLDALAAYTAAYASAITTHDT